MRTIDADVFIAMLTQFIDYMDLHGKGNPYAETVTNTAKAVRNAAEKAATVHHEPKEDARDA